MFQVQAVEDLDHAEHHKTEMEMESKSLKKQQESMNAKYASMSDEQQMSPECNKHCWMKATISTNSVMVTNN
jgi:hypothetical protein